jgi:hypothetical protein
MFESFLKARLCNTRGTPPLELNVVCIVEAMGIEDGGEVDVLIVTAREVSGAIVCEGFNPFSTWGEVKLWVISVRVSMAAPHCRCDARCEGRWCDLYAINL